MQIPKTKHDKIQYMRMRQKRGNRGMKVIGNVEDSTGRKMKSVWF